MEWVKIEAGKYESADGRYSIRKTWDRSFGNHWTMTDNNARARVLREMEGMPSADINLAIRRLEINRSTLAKCKELAERI